MAKKEKTRRRGHHRYVPPLQPPFNKETTGNSV